MKIKERIVSAETIHRNTVVTNIAWFYFVFLEPFIALKLLYMANFYLTLLRIVNNNIESIYKMQKC